MNKMKVLILTNSHERHFYFVNELIKNTNVIGVITDGQRVFRTTREKIAYRLKKKEIWPLIRNSVLNTVFMHIKKALENETNNIEIKYFLGNKIRFEEKYSALHLAQVLEPHRSINNEYYVKIIRQCNPDIIAVMGTCLLGKAIINSAPYVLNMHTGLSPYYRGGMSNLWPIIEGDYGKFGVTIHKMSLGIDSGDIIYSKRPEIIADDTYGSINSRCIKIGTKLMIRAIHDIENGKLHTVKQMIPGKLFNERDFNGLVAYRYFQRINNFIDTYKRLADKCELPYAEEITDDDMGACK